tara:strand:- start:16030 stop:17664 length:1635 start_codon:yes stop_codon:yes gene_type:complete
MAQDYTKFFNGISNTSGFDGTIESDFLKLGQIPDNRKPDLIDYNLNGFNDYRAALQNYIRAVYPLDYNNFAASDLGQMLLEMFAYMGTTLTLRADMTANEMYIDTVKDRGNLGRLLELIGVSLRGPTASKATGKLTLPSDITVDPALGISITENNRRVQIINQRSGTPLTYTIMRQQTDGTLNVFSKDITIPADDFNDDNAASGLLLLEGITQSQVGTFGQDANRQTITINNSPVIEGSIGVSSNEPFGAHGGTYYNEISNLYVASGGNTAVFEKKYNRDMTATLFFGDGVRGRMPTPGANFIVTYRTGGGVNGDIARGSLDAPVSVLNGVNTVDANIVNTTKGSGGTAAESVAHAKRYAPYFFRTQYRAVTGEDYNALANSFVGVAGKTAKAMASLRKNGAAANVIDLFVLAKASETQLERASVAYKKELLDYFQDYKMLTDDIVVSDGVIRTLDLVATLYIDSSNRQNADNIKQKTANELLRYFNVDNMEFGQVLSLADLNNFMLQVPEVRFFKINNIDSDIYVNFNEIIQLNNFEFTVELV